MLGVLENILIDFVKWTIFILLALQSFAVRQGSVWLRFYLLCTLTFSHRSWPINRCLCGWHVFNLPFCRGFRKKNNLL